MYKNEYNYFSYRDLVYSIVPIVNITVLYS